MNLTPSEAEEALEAMLVSNGLGYRTDGDFIYVYSSEELAKLCEAERKVDTRLFRLTYVNAAVAHDMIKPMISNIGSISVTPPSDVGLGGEEGTKDTTGDSLATPDTLVVTDYVERLEDRMDRYLGSDRFYLLLLGIFACLAMVLAAVGLYGVVAYLVSRRTREIGIRVALGAEKGEVLRLVLKQSLGPVILGAVVGLGAALAGGGVLSGLLYQVEPWDPPTYIGGTVLFMGVTFLATLAPARSATRIAPTEAMRME